jgi:branched-chain amino acid transport system permease protein
LVPLIVGLATIGAIMVFMSRTYIGKAIIAVSQDPLALRLVGGNPVRVKEIAFGLSIATAVLSGALLIIIQPIEPSLGRDFIGRVFAIAVLGGMTSLPGTILASMILGVAESMTTTFFGPSWSPAVAFGLLLVTLAVKPAGILGR